MDNAIMRIGKSLSPAIFLCIFWASGVPFAPVWGQAPGGFGAVGGTVWDVDRIGIPDCTVVLSNDSLAIRRPMNTTDDGVFYAPTLPAASGYKLRVTRRNFTSWDSPEFSISTGQKVNWDITIRSLETPNAKASGEERPVEDTKAGLAAEIRPLEDSDTPASGRTPDALVQLAPGATEADSVPGVFAFHGVPYSNLFLTDGIQTTNLYPLDKPGVAMQLPLDGIQDFQIASADFLAEFGGTAGGVIDAGTPSGTTAYHGEGYGFSRAPGWQAEDKYALGYNVKQQEEQAGLDFGGPILQDKRIFFYGNFDLLDRSGNGLNRITNPLIANPSGTAVLASNCQATAAQCAVAARFIQSQMNVLEPLWEHSYRGLVKVDWRRSNRNSITAEANALQWKAPNLALTEDVAPNGGMIGDPILSEQTRYAKIGWTAMGGNQVTNDLRLGFFQDRLTDNPAPNGLSTGTLGISIAGTTVGATQPYAAVLPSERNYEALDNGNWTLGSHTIRVGASMIWTRDYLDELANQGGLYTYPSLTAFAEDFSMTGERNYTSFAQTLGDPVRNLPTRNMAVYAEDTWRASPKLTITYGLRYEREHLTQPTEVNTSYYLTDTVTEPWLNLSPRFGAAYMLDDKTVVRAGYGWYYAPVSGQLLDSLYLGNGLYQSSALVTPVISGAPVFPQIIPAAGAIPNGSLNISYALTTFRNPYIGEATLALERRINSDTSVTLSLMHNRGYHLWTTEDYNEANPTYYNSANPTSTQVINETYNIENSSGSVVNTYTNLLWYAKNNSSFQHVYQIENSGSSWYNAASLQVRRRLSHGLSLIASYTWSHSIDDTGQNAPFGAGFSSTYNQNYTADMGNSQFDQRHHAAIQWVWQPAITSSKSFLARNFVNGWQVTGIATLASSQFDTPIIVVDGQLFSGVTMNYTSTINGSDGWNRVPFLPIGSLPTGPEYNIDARISRVVPINERIRAVLLFEGYNILNMQYNTQVNTIAYTAVSQLPPGLLSGATVGTLIPVPGLGTGIAAQGFPDGANARRLQAGFRVVF